ncbi:hypothetical protein VKT23_016499 [Stygiomarasmius scandens]|uniref:N-acetyltransferase domain-containing protein n=1 Tax=Marasmiellus scandens TaxID=2682957 RepID=A0ABR1IVB4_9AGAR
MTTPPAPFSLKSHTNRIILIPPSSSNDEAFRQLRMHPTTRKYLRYMPSELSMEELKKFREDNERGREKGVEFNFDIHLLDDKEEIGTYVGNTGFFRIDRTHRSCGMGAVLSPEVHRKGICTDVLYTLLVYVFEHGIGSDQDEPDARMKMHRVSFTTASDNVSMRGWLENVAGARHEGTIKDFWRDQDGGWSDVVMYGFLEDEWRDEVKERLKKKLGLQS